MCTIRRKSCGRKDRRIGEACALSVVRWFDLLHAKNILKLVYDVNYVSLSSTVFLINFFDLVNTELGLSFDFSFLLLRLCICTFWMYICTFWVYLHILGVYLHILGVYLHILVYICTFWVYMCTFWGYICTFWGYICTFWVYICTFWVYICTLWVYICTFWVYICTFWVYICTFWGLIYLSAHIWRPVIFDNGGLCEVFINLSVEEEKLDMEMQSFSWEAISRLVSE
jgi:hypothetical protein